MGPSAFALAALTELLAACIAAHHMPNLQDMLQVRTCGCALWGTRVHVLVRARALARRSRAHNLGLFTSTAADDNIHLADEEGGGDDGSSKVARTVLKSPQKLE